MVHTYIYIYICELQALSLDTRLDTSLISFKRLNRIPDCTCQIIEISEIVQYIFFFTISRVVN